MPQSSLYYLVQPIAPRAHRFAVELRIQPTHAEPLMLSLPAWIPGSYMIRDFARNILCIEARDEEGPLALEKLDKQTWRLVPRGHPVRVRLEVYAGDLSVRSANLDDTHGYFNGASLFLRVGGLDRFPCQVEIRRPSGDNYAHWRLATSLKPREAEPFGFGIFDADDYEDLIDHPVEMGVFSLIPFEVLGIPHWLSLTGRHRADEARLQRDLSRICATHAALFGELPIDRYLFLTQVTAEGYGGLEHRYSTSLLCARDDLPALGMDKPTPGYRRFLGLCSHEYFHLWHVKRIRPQAFLAAGLEREVHTRLLWAFEGITSYYDELALVRSGCIDEAGYLELLAETISRVLRNPGRLLQTLAESSFDAWTKFYRPDENSPNAIVSYYAKGALVALALDLLIRRDTVGAQSLDEVMRALWERHGRTGIGLEERGLEALAVEVTGLPLGPLFQQALDSTQDLDLVGPLAAMGVGMRLRAARHAKDLGGLASGDSTTLVPPTLGLRLRPDGGEPQIAHVLTGGPALVAGLAPGDTLVALDGLRVTRDNLDKLLLAAGEGAEVEIHAFRRDELQVRRVRLAPAPLDTCELWLLEDAPEDSHRRRAAWLGPRG
jgi:predicted metalloprotease with PDZ domain